MMRITTKRGDGGKTRICGGGAVLKCDPRVRTASAMDEAISFLGLAKTKVKDAAIRRAIDSAQKDLFKAIAEVLTAGRNTSRYRSPVKDEDVRRLERIGDIIERKTRLPSGFVVPGVNEKSAALHVARTVVRRAECLVSELNKKKKINPCIPAYLNRLSDLLFVMAVHEEGTSDPLRYG